MKKTELIMGIVVIVITTLLVVLLPFIVEYTAERLSLLCLLSVMGYITGFLLIDSFLTRHEWHHYMRGYDASTVDNSI